MAPGRDIVGRIARALPPTWLGHLDRLRPSLRRSWGGPLNGQRERQAIVRSLADSFAFDSVLETGTYRGTTTEFLAATFDVPVETVEQNARYYTYSRARLSGDSRISVAMGDSRNFLRRVAQRRSNDTVFIYLDAHWNEDLPLREELEIIAAHWSRAVVMIDDFAVPDDAGYGYDDYGSGNALTEELLPAMPGWSVRYPAASSTLETGRKRGCCVLLSPALADEPVAGLRA